jgi:membrane-bound lytic murein transglycosylase A
MSAGRHVTRRFSPQLLTALILGLLAGGALTSALLPRPACSQTGCPSPVEPPLPVVGLTDITFADIPGWGDDDMAPALTAFRASCRGITADPARFARFPAFGSASAWTRVCAAAASADPAGARAFFETNFTPARVGEGDVLTGKVTGYYEPELSGSRTQSPAYPAPVYARPPDLVTADPDAFRTLLRGERLSGKVVDGVLKPYETRAEIEAAGLKGRAEPLLYLPSTADAFFLQVQGSGRVTLAEGGAVRLNYAAQNGRPYTAIGAALIAEGAIPREKMSMQAIRAWLADNPARAAEIMNLNASYVFFRELPLADLSEGPPGAEGVALTPGTSLAVDSRLYPYGLPVFVTATGTGAGDIARLMIAQDTGGAIRGVVRGDIFFGWGAEAETAAGATNAPATFIVLRPK